MTDSEIYDLYVIQSKNVRRLKQVQASLVKDINTNIKRQNAFQVEIKTKLLSLLFSTLSEAQFIQIVHTPNGFTAQEIEEIKKAKSSSLEDGWRKLIDTAMDKVGLWQSNSDLLNRRDKLVNIVTEYIIKPSILRNKIAHGQWEYALNRENTRENVDLTSELQDLDVVKVQKWFDVHQFMALIIRDLIQSPRKGFHNNYWNHLTELDQYLLDTKSWTFASKKLALGKKPIPELKQHK